MPTLTLPRGSIVVALILGVAALGAASGLVLSEHADGGAFVEVGLVNHNMDAVRARALAASDPSHALHGKFLSFEDLRALMHRPRALAAGQALPGESHRARCRVDHTGAPLAGHRARAKGARATTTAVDPPQAGGGNDRVQPTTHRRAGESSAHAAPEDPPQPSGRPALALGSTQG